MNTDRPIRLTYKNGRSTRPMSTHLSYIRVHVTALILCIGITALYGCHPTLKEAARHPEDAMTRVRWFYPPFHDDMDRDSLISAIQKNSEYLTRLPPERLFRYGPDTFTAREVLQSQRAFCRLIEKDVPIAQLNRIIKKNYLVYRAAGRAGNNTVLFTGYFEPVFDARRTPDETFRYPIYRKPKDLITIDLSRFDDGFQDRRLMARIEENAVIPYYTRQEIDHERVLAGRGLEIAWLKDPVDVTFLQIQGSGRLRFPDGNTVCVGYASSNGHPYRSIGRYMIDKGLIPMEAISMQAIRRYLHHHPDQRSRILNHNPSYIFFRILKNGPLGNISVPLTPGRSIALDATLFPKGALGFISCVKPSTNKEGKITGWHPFSRFVLNQDTGGAIKGAGRADLFWGRGIHARTAAGHFKHEGELYILIKRP